MSSASESTFLRVIGVGSPLGDDEIGWRVVDALASAQWLQPFIGNGVELGCLDRPGVALLDQMAGVPQAVVIDAMVSGREPGTVILFEWPFSTKEAGLLSSHGFGVGEVLRLGQVLGTLPSCLSVLGIEIDPQPWAENGKKEGKWELANILKSIENILQLLIEKDNRLSRQRVSGQS